MEPKEVAKNYLNLFLKYNGNFSEDLPDEWVYCHDLVRDNAQGGFIQTVELINACNSLKEDDPMKYKWIYYIAAGELEELISKHGEEIIDSVVHEMKFNDTFLLACTGVWPLGRKQTDPIWQKFQQILTGGINAKPKVKVLWQKYG